MVNLSARSPNRRYACSAPIITANWLVPAGQQWIVPVGGGGRVIKLFDKLPINLQLQGFYNALHPARPRPCQLCSQLTSSSERDIS